MTTLSEQSLDTPLFTLNGQIYPAKCVKCYDADTIHVVILLHGTYTRFRCRLKGIDTAELRSKNKEEKAHAKQARDYLKTLILNKLVTIRCYDFDKYGRLLVDVFCESPSILTNVVPHTHPILPVLAQTNEHHIGGGNETNIEQSHVNINNHLIDCGYAYVYKGGKRKAFSEWK